MNEYGFACLLACLLLLLLLLVAGLPVRKPASGGQPSVQTCDRKPPRLHGGSTAMIETELEAPEAPLSPQACGERGASGASSSVSIMAVDPPCRRGGLRSQVCTDGCPPEAGFLTGNPATSNNNNNNKQASKQANPYSFTRGGCHARPPPFRRAQS